VQHRHDDADHRHDDEEHRRAAFADQQIEQRTFLTGFI
jgi:hypothetical protein